MQSVMLINSTSNDVHDEPKKPFLPVLIIPGFMSSGLQIVKSTHKESWQGKRVWLSLHSLGMEAMQLGTKDLKEVSLNETDTQGDAADCQTVLRNMWLQHMVLADDMVSERTGVEVRNIEGLAGVDYLAPGTLTNFLSYVFGPVIRALQGVGYKEGRNLDAAPYDWRLPPRILEERDHFFTRTMTKVEKLYSQNNNTPVVLLCHSQGAKIGHYFLNFAKSQRGQTWIDQHIHTYMPVGGAHLGAPKALRSIISGDRMGLDAFLSDSQALLFGRSLGSGLGLLPKELPMDAPSVVYIRGDGAFELKLKTKIDSHVFLCNRIEEHCPQKLKLTLVFERSGLSTPFVPIEVDNGVSFGQTFTFRTPCDKMPPDSSVAILLCEPGVRLARRSHTRFYALRQVWFERFFSQWKCDCICTKWVLWRGTFCVFLRCLTCWWLVWPIVRYAIEFGLKVFLGGTYVALYWLYAGTILSADEISKLSGGSSVLAAGKIASIKNVLDGHDEVDVEVILVSHRDKTRWFTCYDPRRITKVTVSIRWVQTDSSRIVGNGLGCSAICQAQADCRSVGEVRHKRNEERCYQPVSGLELIVKEDLPRVIETLQSVYDVDPIDPRGLSSFSPPPVRLVKAVYGINLPTEVGAFYKRRRAVLHPTDKLRNMITIDKNVQLDGIDGHIAEDGILKETKDTPQCLRGTSSSKDGSVLRSGDGTVPYWSLQHVRTWENHCQVDVEELEGAEHREILADKRFHSILLDYVCSNQSSIPETTL